MKFQQIFVTINMLMDHTASGAIMPQLGMASSASKAELARPVASQSSGVVYPLTTQAHHQKLEHTAQMEAQVEQEYGSTSGAIHNDRKLQADWTWTYGPPVPYAYPKNADKVPGLAEPTIPASSHSSVDIYKIIIGVGSAVTVLCVGALYHLCKPFRCGGRKDAKDTFKVDQV